MILQSNLKIYCRNNRQTLIIFIFQEGMFQRVVRERHESVKNQCDVHEKLGDSNFHDRYASKMLSRLCLLVFVNFCC